MKRFVVLFRIARLSLLALAAVSVRAAEYGEIHLTQKKSEPALTSEKGPHHRVWQTVTETTLPNGKTKNHTNSFVEVQTGMHYFEDGQWLESSEQIEVQGGKGVASHGQHKVVFSGKINTAHPIILTSPDGKVFKSRVLGLSLYDAKTKRSTLVAELKESSGVVVGNQVIYQDAFTDVKADIRYTYMKGGLEQDIILREQLPVSPEDFQMDPATTRLQVLTEFFDPPQPSKRPAQRKGMLIDGKLDFGAMQMGQGKAFSVGEQDTASVGVDKEWLELEGRQFLVENVHYQEIKPKLNLLPLRPVAATSNKMRKRVASVKRTLPVFEAKEETAGGMKMAALSQSEQGLVLDYSLLNTDKTNYIFQGDTTYFVRGDLNLSGTTIIEGGAVIKYTNGAKITIFGTVDCLAEPYHPAILTSYKDNTVGETISAGTPSGTYATTALSLFTGGNLQNLHIRYAGTGVYSPQVCTLTDMQFVHCGKGLDAYYTTFSARNVLMYDVTNAFCGRYSSGIAQHLTFHQGNKLILDNNNPSCSMSLTLVNSLAFGFSSWGSCTPTLDHTEYATSDPGTVFQTVGSASHYLADNSGYRNAGGTNIDNDLRDLLKTKTTYPPVVITSTNAYTNSLNLIQIANRDLDTLDLGYHYSALDYALGNLFVTNASINVAPGTAIGTFSTITNFGIRLGPGATLDAQGTATNLIRIATYDTVQEQSNTNWYECESLQTPLTSSSPEPSANLRFTEWTIMAGGVHTFHAFFGEMPSISFRDSQFRGGRFGTEGPSLAITNCLFERVSVELYDWVGANNMYMDNCLSYGGTVYTSHIDSGEWSFKDNTYDHTSVRQDSEGSVTNGYNAYIGDVTLWFPTNSLEHNIRVTNYVMTSYTNLPGSPILWLKADAGVTTNASGLVTQWNDQSGNGNNATQSDTNHSPLFVSNVLNGKPALRFDGDQDNTDLGDFLHGSGDVGLSAGFTSFIVYSMGDRAIAEQVPVMIGNPWEFNMTRGYYIRNGFSLGSVNELAFGAWANDYGSRYIIPASTYRIWGYRLNDEMSRFDFLDTDGVYTYNDSENVSGFDTPSAGYFVGGLGDDAPYYYFQGDILEVIFYDAALSDSDRAQVVNYLKQKYNLPFTPYEAGSLGRYYQVSYSPLINAGSTSATNVGLYHFTTQANEIKETNSIVDIGFHYVAMTNGTPIDTDGEGLTDYLEDTNGNGNIDASESSWTSADTDGDGVDDYLEWVLGRKPTISGSQADVSDATKLRVHTPLK